jgi:hypothetical protein
MAIRVVRLGSPHLPDEGMRLGAELMGEAGDIVLTHPWVLHCRGMNCAAVPRFMRGKDIYRRSVARDLGMVPTPRPTAGSRRS